MFREANLKDVKTLAELGRILVLHEKKSDPYLKGMSLNQSFNHYSSELSNSKSKFYVFEHKGLVVAYIYGFIKKAPDYLEGIEKIGYLEACVVKEEYRGKKISYRLTEMLLDWFKEHNVSLVELGVYFNNNSLYVWKKLGFEEHHITMRKKL